MDLRNHTIEEFWNGSEFEAFRNHFRHACPDCPKRELCMGGCPIKPEIVLCDKKFPFREDDFTNEKVNNLPIVRDKNGKSIVLIPQMIEIATNKRWKEDFDNKHKKRAKNGWFRYNTRFAMPVMNDDGEIIEYNIYQAVLIVRYAADGRLYLYDVQNIKKEMRYPSRTIMSDG